MLIRPTSIIAHSIVDGDLRTFSHSLNQEVLTDTDCVIPIWHKGQLTQIHWKDLSAGMSPASVYQRDWYTACQLDTDFVVQGCTWFREVDDEDGLLKAYWFKGSQSLLSDYNTILANIGLTTKCVMHRRFIQFDITIPSYQQAQTIDQAVSRWLGLCVVYGIVQVQNAIVTSVKCTLPLTGYTRLLLECIQEDIALLRSNGLFIQLYHGTTAHREYVELVCTDAELLQSIISYLQYIDSDITMTTLETLQNRSTQVIALGVPTNDCVIKFRTLD